jgi:hypothetical protein
MLGPITTDRFMQPDGNIYLDFTQAGSPAAVGVTVYCVQNPFVFV